MCSPRPEKESPYPYSINSAFARRRTPTSSSPLPPPLRQVCDVPSSPSFRGGMEEKEWKGKLRRWCKYESTERRRLGGTHGGGGGVSADGETSPFLRPRGLRGRPKRRWLVIKGDGELGRNFSSPPTVSLLPNQRRKDPLKRHPLPPTFLRRALNWRRWMEETGEDEGKGEEKEVGRLT